MNKFGCMNERFFTAWLHVHKWTVLLLAWFSIILAFGTRLVSAQPQKIKKPQMIRVVEGSPYNADGTTNWQVILTSPQVMLDASLDRALTDKMFQMVRRFQKEVQAVKRSIPADLPNAARQLEEWVQVQDVQQDFESTVVSEFDAEFLDQLVRTVVRNYEQHGLISHFILSEGVARQLALQPKQVQSIRETGKRLEKKFRARLEEQAAIDLKAQIAWLPVQQKTLMEKSIQISDFTKRLSREKLSIERLISQRVYRRGLSVGSTSVRTEAKPNSSKEKSGAKSSVPFGFGVFLRNQSIQSKLDLSDRQKSEFDSLLRSHVINLNNLPPAVESEKIGREIERFNTGVERLLLPAQHDLLRKHVFLRFLTRLSPMNFLRLPFVSTELELTDDQLNKLERKYDEIKAKGDQRIEQIKSDSDEKILKELSKDQRTVLAEILRD